MKIRLKSYRYNYLFFIKKALLLLIKALFKKDYVYVILLLFFATYDRFHWKSILIDKSPL